MLFCMFVGNFSKKNHGLYFVLDCSTCAPCGTCATWGTCATIEDKIKSVIFFRKIANKHAEEQGRFLTKFKPKTLKKTPKRVCFPGRHSDLNTLAVRECGRGFENKLLCLTPQPAPTTQAPHRCQPPPMQHRGRKLRRLHLHHTPNSLLHEIDFL